MAITAQQLENWTARSSADETDKCERSLRMIRQALTSHAELQRRPYRLIAQGSYHNNTNVRLTSDVDICVVFTDVAATDFTYAEGDTFESLGFSPSDKVYEYDRALVETALRNVFGRNMDVGNKAFAVHSTQTTRVDADVVAAWGFCGYTNDSGKRGVNEGITFWTRDGRQVVNFPEQHHKNGAAKNVRTNRFYKRAVRILKRMRYSMRDNDIASADGVSSFLLECAMYNVPDEHFMLSTWRETMRSAIRWMLVELEAGRAERQWVESSEKKWLFQASYGIPSNWTDTQLTEFLRDALELLDG